MRPTFPLDATVVHVDDRSMSPHAKLADGLGDQFPVGHLVSRFTYDRTWPYRERHPDGDELVAVVDGALELELDGGDRATVALEAGQACIIPAGCWHRAVVRGHADVVFVTPSPATTEHLPDDASGPRLLG